MAPRGNNMVCNYFKFFKLFVIIYSCPMRIFTNIGNVASKHGSINRPVSFVVVRHAWPRLQRWHPARLPDCFVPLFAARAFVTTPKSDLAVVSLWKNWRPQVSPNMRPNHLALLSTFAVSTALLSLLRFIFFDSISKHFILQRNAKRLKEYRSRLIIFPKKLSKTKKGDSSVSIQALIN